MLLVFNYVILSIPFCPIMRPTQHLAVFDCGFAAFTPRRYVVGIHFFQFPDAMCILVVTDSAIRTVRSVLGFGLSCLLFINLTHRTLAT